MYDSYHFWDGPVNESLWFAPHVKEFRQVSTHHDPVKGINDRTPAGKPRIVNAAANRAMAINVPQYLLYLQSRGAALGIKVIKAHLPVEKGLESALNEAESIASTNGRRKVDCFVNATGLGAGKLCGDKAVYPIRGQTVLVKGEAECTRTRRRDARYSDYVIPRPGSGTTILGGTKEVGNWSEVVDPEITERTLGNCALLAPELLTAGHGGFEVVSVQCGLRPGRQGGPRMEGEVVGERRVVHAYGHAGGGYQNSVGSARAVVGLVGKSVGGGAAVAKL